MGRNRQELRRAYGWEVSDVSQQTPKTRDRVRAGRSGDGHWRSAGDRGCLPLEFGGVPMPLRLLHIAHCLEVILLQDGEAE